MILARLRFYILEMKNNMLKMELLLWFSEILFIFFLIMNYIIFLDLCFSLVLGAPPQPSYKNSHHEPQPTVKMPIAGAAHNQNKNVNNIHNSGSSAMHYQQQQHNSQHHQNPSTFNTGGPYSSHQQHTPRGKNIVARIQQTNDDLTSSTDEDDDDYGHGKRSGMGSGYQKVNTAGISFLTFFKTPLSVENTFEISIYLIT